MLSARWTECGQKRGGLRSNQPGVQSLIEVHPHLFTAHATDLLQLMPRGQHIVVPKNDLPTVTDTAKGQISHG